MRRITAVSMSAIAAVCIFTVTETVRAGDAYQSATQPKVTVQRTSAMDAAFKAGRDYFVWTTNTTVKGTVAPMIGSTLHLYIHVTAKSEVGAPPFRIYMELEARIAETKEITKFTTTFPGKSEKANAFEADRLYDVFFFAGQTSLTGVGVTKVYLIAADGKTEKPAPISNIMELKVEF